MSHIATPTRRRVTVPLRRIDVPANKRVDTPLFRGLKRFPAPAVDTRAVLVLLTLFFTVPLFAQIFHYLKELPPPYFLSKLWPALTTPLMVYAMVRMRLPGSWIFLVFFAYTLGLTPLISMVYLGNNYVDAITTTVKVWPVAYYFSLSALLSLLAVPPEMLRRVFIAYGVLTFILLVLVWVGAPTSWYSNDPEDGKLLQIDAERGYRIVMPTFFAFFLIFYCGRRLVQTRKPIHGAVILVGYVVLAIIYKQRTAIGSAFLVTCFGMVMTLPKRSRHLVMGLGLALATLGAAALAYKLGLFTGAALNSFERGFGDSLMVRKISSSLAIGFLGDDPLRWLFGVGATTRFGSVSIEQILGFKQFFISDLGWLGVVFEYGLIGAVLLAGLHLWGFGVTFFAGQSSQDPFVMALSDYILYIILTSVVYSLMFLPGEFAVALAVALHVMRMRAQKALRPSPHTVSLHAGRTAPVPGAKAGAGHAS